MEEAEEVEQVEVGNLPSSRVKSLRTSRRRGDSLAIPNSLANITNGLAHVTNSLTNSLANSLGSGRA